MNLQPARKNKTIRNLTIFIICIIAIPWLGWGLDVSRNANPHDQQNSLGWLLFIITPLAVSLLLRAFAGDGWKDTGINPAFKGNGKWYLFALVFHPVSIVLVLLIGAILGATSVPDLSVAKFVLIGQTILAALIPNFIKNIFEEFAWRGYLAPKVQSVIENPLVGHVLVGVVWFAWHLPYYLVLLSTADLQQSTALGLGGLLFMTFLGIIPTAIIYGELRARTNSVWPAVLIHVGANVSFDALVLQKFFIIPGTNAELLFSPALFSLLTIALNLTVGLWLYRQRPKTAQGVQNA